MLNGIADKNTCNSEQKHSEWFVMLVCLTQMSIFQVFVFNRAFFVGQEFDFHLKSTYFSLFF